MIKKLSWMFGTGLSLLLLVYTAARSLDFIAMTLPEEKRFLAWAGLAALDGGLLAWLMMFKNSAHGWQRPVSLVMVGVDFLGCALMFTMDTIYNTGQSGMTNQLTASQMMAAVIVLSCVIAANVGAYIVYQLVDPAHRRQMAEEEAVDRIEELAIKSIRDNAAQLAAQLAPVMGRDWRNREIARHRSLINGGRSAAQLPEISVGKPLEIDGIVPEKAVDLPEKASLELPENPTRPARSRGRK